MTSTDNQPCREALLPCPFCGGEAIITIVDPHTHKLAHWMPDCEGETFVECPACAAAIVSIKAWNTRTPPISYDAAVEVLRKRMIRKWAKILITAKWY